MCVMWMPANLLSSGIVDKNDKILFKKENKNASPDDENSKINTEKQTLEEQSEKK